MRQFAGRHDGVVLGRQTGEREGRPPRAQHHLVALAAGLQLNLRAFAQFADDVVKRVRRHRRAAFPLDPRRHALDNLQIHVGGAQRQPSGHLRPQQHIGQNGDGRPPFDDTLNMAERLEEGGPFDGELHGGCTTVYRSDGDPVRRPRTVRARGRRRDRSIAWKRRRTAPFADPPRSLRGAKRGSNPHPIDARPGDCFAGARNDASGQLCSMRRRSSTSSASAESLSISSSIFLTA